jgi:hypothetical protein
LASRVKSATSDWRDATCAVADNDERFSYSFHLDDPAVNYFTHREILSLAMKSI